MSAQAKQVYVCTTYCWWCRKSVLVANQAPTVAPGGASIGLRVLHSHPAVLLHGPSASGRAAPRRRWGQGWWKRGRGKKGGVQNCSCFCIPFEAFRHELLTTLSAPPRLSTGSRLHEHCVPNGRPLLPAAQWPPAKPANHDLVLAPTSPRSWVKRSFET